MTRNEPQKIEWRGAIASIQVRATVWRYKLDNRTHSEIGYNLFLGGEANGTPGWFSVAISEKQQEKGEFRIGDEVSGTAWTKMYDVSDYADYYRAGALKRLSAAEQNGADAAPPWKVAPPPLETYSWRGARQLALSRWKDKCFQCAWANMSAVEIEYNWGVSKKYRFESFCYGPKSCKLYEMGKARSVPYKDSSTDYDTGWLDDICTERRDYDE
jgi:hypothetical protein